MVVVLLIVLIGAIVYFSQRARSNYFVSVPRGDRGETWMFNVRDMRVELRQSESSKLLETYDLRRVTESRWEVAEIDDEDPENRTWLPCEKAVAGNLEAKYRRYNDGDDG